MSQIKKFFAILRLELEDIQDDLESMIHIHQRRHDDGIMSDNILRSNSALFKKEIGCIRDFIHQLDIDCCADYDSVEDVIARINSELPGKVEKFDYPLVVVDMVRRKMGKIRNYLEYSSDQGLPGKK